MDVGTVFKLSLYSLTAFVGAILGIAEGEGAIAGTTRAELFLPYGSIPVVICGYLLTERSKRIGTRGTAGLSAIWANSFGIVALIATAYEFTRENRESKLLAGTHLLLYATWIVLFQQKSIRSYWFLMALGILQLSIASVLTRSGWFGFAAVVYLFAAVWTLSIFSLWRAEQLFEEENRTHGMDGASERAGPANGGEVVRLRRTSDVRGTIQHEGGTHWLTSRFVTGVMTTALAALIVSTAFFAFIPRVWVGSEFSFQEDLDRFAGIHRKTGLTTTVRLGDLSSTLESAEKVFEIQITHHKEKIPIQKYAETLGMSEPLFRGGVMTNYEKGNWSVDRTSDYLVPPFQVRRNQLSQDNVVRQDLHVERADPGPLFCLGRPIYAFYGKQLVAGGYQDSTGIAIRGENSANDYSIFTLMPTQQKLHFKLAVRGETFAHYGISDYLEICTSLPPDLTRLKVLAEEIVRKETAQRNKAELRTEPRELTPLEKANAIEYYLRESGQYTYSLDASVVDSKIDPVEDFLFNRKTGHCEYFATALTLMLRAVDIPARVVSGYKGGIEHGNSESSATRLYSFEVQKRYAHLWSEAWVDSDADNGWGWTTFDATPRDGRSSSIADLSARRGSVWTDMTSRLSTLWSESILNLSLERQEESIYKPLRELGLSMANFAYELFSSPESVLDSFWALLQNRKQWLSIEGGLLAFVILLVITLLGWGIRKLISKMSNRSLWQQQRRQRVIKFYERFLTLMKRHGMNRMPMQTQHEFAQSVTDQFRPLLMEKGMIDIPDEVSRYFYRVRFGEDELSKAELAAMEEALTRFEQAMNERNQTASAPTSAN